jgi:hypothetical protein
MARVWPKKYATKKAAPKEAMAVATTMNGIACESLIPAHANAFGLLALMQYGVKEAACKAAHMLSRTAVLLSK